MADAKRKRILDAVEQLVVGRRFHEVTMDEVAAEARVSKGTLYHHFQDKEDLFRQLVFHGHDDLCATLRECTAGDASFEERLWAVCRHIGEFMSKRHAVVRLMQEHEMRRESSGKGMHREFERRRRQLVDVVAGLLSDGQRAGRLRGDVPAEAQAALLIGMVHTSRAIGQNESFEHLDVTRLVDFFLSGARGRRTGVEAT